jgi:hypothetical protein
MMTYRVQDNLSLGQKKQQAGCLLFFDFFKSVIKLYFIAIYVAVPI